MNAGFRMMVLPSGIVKYKGKDRQNGALRQGQFLHGAETPVFRPARAEQQNCPIRQQRNPKLHKDLRCCKSQNFRHCRSLYRFRLKIGLYIISEKCYTFVNGGTMTDYTLPAWKIKQLTKFHKTLKQKHEAYRINAIILLGSGWTPAQVAEVLLIPEGSVRTYFKDFQAHGKEELLRRDYTGRESFLSEEQE
jgi:hypothetical protein